MSTHIGIGFSRELNAEKAAEEAALQSKAKFTENRVDFALVFSTIDYKPEKILPVIQKILSKAKTIGCSTAGLISSEFIDTRGIAILAMTSDDIQFGIGSVNNIDSQDMIQAGRILAKNSVTDFGQHGRQVFLFFVDSLVKNNSRLLKGIQEVLGNVFPIIGAGSCDDFHFEDTFQIYQNRILKRSATGIMLGGHTSVGVGGGHGWRPLGKPRVISEVNGNIIRTIDNQRAASIYEEYFGEESAALHSNHLDPMAILYPLGIYVEESKEYLLRNAVEILPDGSISCQGEVPEGAQVNIMIGNKEACKEAAFEAAKEAHNDLLGREAKLVIIIESMARLKLLGRTAFQEIKKIKEVFGPHVPFIGMYANGEISPFQTIEKFKKPHLQNDSIVVLAIS